MNRISFLLIVMLFFNGKAQVDEDFEQIKETIANFKDFSNYVDSSRVGRYRHAIGKYKMVLNTNRTVINAGDTVVVDLFVSGYGRINAAKLFFMPTTNIFREDSFLVDGMTVKKTEKGYEYVTDTTFLKKDKRVLLFMGGMYNHEKKYYRTLFHANLPENTLEQLGSLENIEIVTESNDEFNGKIVPPFQFHYIVKEEIPPGDYKINFVFNYFNGNQFELDVVTLDIKVMAWYERQEGMIQVLGVLLTVFTLLGTIYMGYKFFTRLKFLKRFRIKKKK